MLVAADLLLEMLVVQRSAAAETKVRLHRDGTAAHAFSHDSETWLASQLLFSCPDCIPRHCPPLCSIPATTTWIHANCMRLAQATLVSSVRLAYAAEMPCQTAMHRALWAVCFSEP